jgi:S1-C subfamily serine protease
LEAITRNGRDGLLISYVYAGSTAEKIGLKPGDVLLKLMIPDMGKMLRLERDRFAVHQAQQFPWQQLDRIPEMYYGEIPEPWNSVKNALNNYLTAIGIGQKVELIVFSNGNVSRKEFVIAAAPVYYEIAPVYSSKSFGLEVRNMTYEVRRYFRMNEKTPGVIISNVFAGSSASTAGLKPFEIITAVNDKPVHTVEEFRKALEGVSELRLSVRRLASNRVVTVKAKVGPRR